MGTLSEAQLEEFTNCITVENIAEYLKSLKLDQYITNFTKNDVDGNLLWHLTDDDLKDIGITKGFDRRKILNKFKPYVMKIAQQQV